MKKILLAFALSCALGSFALAQGPIPPIPSGYGANGSFAVTIDKFPSPLYDNEKVQVFRPAGATAPVPVIFFAPGFNNNDPDEYRPLINHIVSRGYALVYAPFQFFHGISRCTKNATTPSGWASLKLSNGSARRSI